MRKGQRELGVEGDQSNGVLSGVSSAIDTPEEASRAQGAYDPARYERPSVTVDVVILTMRRRRLEALPHQKKALAIRGAVGNPWRICQSG